MSTSQTTTSIPTWSPTAIYTKGMTVTQGGVVYVANWWTQDTNPAANNGATGSGEPWTIVPAAAGGPTVVPTAPTHLALVSKTSSSATLSWAAATVPGGGAVTGYAVFANGKQIGTTTATTYTAAGLAAAATTVFTVTALDAAGASAASGSLSVTTPAGTLPAAPTGLAASDVTANSVALAWTAPATPAGATLSGYTILNNGVAIGTTTGTSFTVTGLAAATAYRLTVEASDQYGTSAPSTALSVQTASGAAAPPGNVPAWSANAVYTAGMTASENGIIYQANWWTQDNNPVGNSGPAGSGEVWTAIGKVNTTPTAPDAPTGLSATALSASTVELAWTASVVPGSGTVSEYAILENGKQIATTTATATQVGGLAASTGYSFTVEAIDATGTSPASSAAAVTTLATGATSSTATFAPYVDMSLYPSPNLAAISEASGIRTFTLAFIQSSGADTLGWGGTGTIASDGLSDGSTVLSQIQALRAIGGNVIISFGGAAGTDPAAVAGMTASGLQAEYQSVIDRYDVTSLDFDIEGAQVADPTSIALRDAALVGLQKANPGLQLSFTLPVLPTGLDSNGVNVIDSAAKAGVDLSVINIMAMDFGSSVDNGGAMGTDAIDAIQATEQQVAAAGLTAKLGVTPMIGVNDVSSEVFTLADAQQLAGYVASDPDVARVAMWSVARDNGSGAGATYASPTSSGLAQSTWQFSSILQHA